MSEARWIVESLQAEFTGFRYGSGRKGMGILTVDFTSYIHPI